MTRRDELKAIAKGATFELAGGFDFTDELAVKLEAKWRGTGSIHTVPVSRIDLSWLVEGYARARLSAMEPQYQRDVLVDTLVHHWPNENASCLCGWAELGRSFPEHVATMYEKALSNSK